MKKICKLCGKEFETTAPNKLLCDEDHYIKCFICGTQFKLSKNMQYEYIKCINKQPVCSRECLQIKKENNCIAKHGVRHFNNRHKAKETILKKYNVNNISQIPEVKEKKKQASLNKYGTICPLNNKIVRQKAKNTKLKRYNDVNYNNRQQACETCLNKYGVTNVHKLEWIKEKARNTCKQKYGDEYYNNMNKNKQTCIKRYGVPYVLQSEQSIKIRKQTSLKKYNRLSPTQRHISTKTLQLLENKEKFKDYINKFKIPNVKLMCEDLGISYFTFWSRVKQHNLQNEIHINKYYSSNELEILEILKQHNIKYISHSRSIISPYELDIYIPNKKVAIECNGIYWHSTKNIKDKNYHYNKSKLCEEKGIRLIHIFEYEWNNERQRPILEDIIKNAIGVNTNKMYARKLDIEIRQSKDMQDFFNTNNIQGFRGGSFAICLVDKKQGKYNLFGNYIKNTGKVYMSYMIGKAFFGKGKYEWEVIRGATLLGYNIIGGASKIWNYFINEYKPKSIVYYIDYNYFNGNSLPYLGLEYIKTQPSFKNYFVKEGIIKNRDPMHHKQIIEGYNNGSILQIWNAGTKVYVWKNK